MLLKFVEIGVYFTMKLITLKKYLERNPYPKSFIDRELIDIEQFNTEPPKVSNTIKFDYYKLPYICHFSKTTKQKLRKIYDQYCIDLSLKIVFTLFKLVIYLV